MRNKTILRSSRLRRDMAWPMLVAATLPVVAPLPSYGQAMPSGAVIGAGKVSISTPSASTMVVRQDSQRAVLNWNSFSIGKGNTVNFSQPNAGAATLNVVKGGAPSEIAGNLKANGSVFLVNQNGIAITPTGMVDTRAGFVASTLGMSEEDFMAERNVFRGKGGAVVNQGQIVTGPGGNVALLGASVSNEGVIRAPLGKVALGAGEAATLDLSGDGYLQLMLPSDAVTAEGQALVSNGGVIEAAGGTVMLKAETVRAALREAVHMPGTIRAQSVSGRDGAIVLEGGAGGVVKVNGALDASASNGAGNGGRIDIGGQQVTLAGAKVDASGETRGGLVRVGGSFQGGKGQEQDSADAQRFAGRFGTTGAAPTNAARTSIDAASSIDVSAHGAQGEGGTAVVWSDQATVMRGNIDARGAGGAGAVEVSSASTVQSVALNRIALGKGGKLLLDPQDIRIDDNPVADPAGDIGFADNPGGVTHLYAGDLTALLGGGTSISLKASQDIDWNTFTSIVTRNFTQAAGSLSLAAGRSVTLQGIFGTADADWNIIANERLANGVVDGERGAGVAIIDLSRANFINSNGKLSLHLEDGAGKSNFDAGGITLGGYAGNGLSATIAPGASWGGGMTPFITLTSDISVAEAVTLTGSLSFSASSVTLSGRRVDWTTEASGAMRGEGKVKFVADGVTTRIGALNGGAPARLALGDGVNAAVSKVYGDADPAAGSLGVPLLHLTSGGAMDALSDILAPGSLATAGPGVTANAGSNSISLGGSNGLAFNGGLSGSYFIDMTPVSMPLTITRRPVTPTVGSYQSTYGTAATVATLNNVVNNDILQPLASLDGGAQEALSAVGAGYGFGATTRAGNHAYAVTGLTGAAAGNYDIAPGTWNGTLSVAQKALTFDTFHASQVYGNNEQYATILTGIVGADNVDAVTAAKVSGGGFAPAGRALAAGDYTYTVVGLSGDAAANYRIADSGNRTSDFTVAPRVLNYSVGNVDTVYGTPAAVGALTLNNVLPGDDLVAGPVGFNVGGVRLTTSGVATPAGSYGQNIASLSGADAGNYTLSGAGPGGTLSIARKRLDGIGSNISQQYGLDLPAPALAGIINGDNVSAVADIVMRDVTGDPTMSGKAPVGVYKIQVGGLSGPAAGNYVLGNAGWNSVTVTQRELTYIAPSLNLTYGDGGTLPAFIFNGHLAGDYLDFAPYVARLGAPSETIDARAPAGSYDVGIFWRAGASSNYKLAASGNTPGVLNIARRPLTWAVGAGSAVYGATAQNPVTLTNLLAGDDVAPLVQALDGNASPIALPGVGSYAAGVTGLGGASGNNYALQASGNTEGTLTVTPKALNLLVHNSQSVYGSLALPTLTFDGLVGSDQVGMQSQVSLQSNGSPVALTERTPAGSYQLQASVQMANNPNYMLGNGSGTAVLTIAPRTLTYTGPTASFEYGTGIRGLSNTLQGVLGSDEVTMPVVLSGSWTDTYAKRAVGQYGLAQTFLFLNGRDAGNYRVTGAGATDGVITIVPKELNYRTYFNIEASQVYGDVRNQVSVLTDFARAFSDDQVSFTPGSLAGASYSTGGYLNAGSYTTRTGTLTGADAGNYRIAASGNSLAELTILPRQVSGAFTVRSLAGAADMGKSMVYGSTSGANLAFKQGQALAGDQLTVDGSFDLPGGPAKSLPGRLAIGSYGVNAALLGRDAQNYYMGGAGQSGLVGMIDISPRPLGVSYPALSTSTYGNTPDVGGTLAGLLLDEKNVQVRGDLMDRNGAVHEVGSRTPAGSYTFNPRELAGSDAIHYAFAPQGASWVESLTGKVMTIAPSGTASIQVDKRILDVNYSGARDMVYGANPSRSSVSGWIYGDERYWEDVLTTTSSPTPGAVGSKVLVPENAGYGRVGAGTYTYAVTLSDEAAKNYQLSRSSLGTFTIAQRAVSAPGVGLSLVYGDANGAAKVAALNPLVDGVLPGEQLTGVQSYFDASGKETGYTARSSAGSYAARVTSLKGEGRTNPYNYSIDGASSAASQLVIKARALTLDLPEVQNAVYGSSPLFGSSAGVLFDDDVTFMLSGAGLAGKALSTTDAVSKNLFYDQRVNVGEYNYQLRLQGAKAGNYVLDGRSGGKMVVTPKTLTWTVSPGTGQYGFYKDCDGYSCSSMERGVDVGKPVYTGVLAGDQVGGTVDLLDLQGRPLLVNDKTPVGNYFQVVSGLNGLSAANYSLSDSGNVPGILTIKPLWLRYSTSSSINMLGGYGVVGVGGVVTLETIGGVPMPNGESVGAKSAIFVPGYNKLVSLDTELPQGRFYYEAYELTGPYAANYRLMPVSHNNYGEPGGVNNVGVYDVYADGRLGLNLVPARDLPTTRPPATIIDRDLTDLDRNWGSIGVPTPEFGRLVDGDGTVIETDLRFNRAGVNLGGGANANLLDTGGVSVDANASGVASALAKYGISGVTVSANVEGHVDITISSGPVAVTAGAQAAAGVDLSIGRAGITISADATVGAYVNAGARGGLGYGATGNLDVQTATFAYAQYNYRYGIQNGVLTMTQGAMVGAGTSLGLNGGVGGQLGNVGGGVTVYSPGVLGSHVGGGVGYSSGVLSMTLDFGVGLGIFGGGFKLNLGLNVGIVGSMFRATESRIDRQPGLDKRGLELKNSPAERYAFLSQNQDWNYMNSGNADNANFMRDYSNLLKATEKMYTDQQVWQADMLKLLQTDPAKAVEQSRNRPDFRSQQLDVRYQSIRLGVALKAENGEIKYVNR